MNEYAPFIAALTEPRNAWLKAGLRDLYALALYEPLPEEWSKLAERIEAAQSPAPRKGDNPKGDKPRRGDKTTS
jgi:hypothetical protein